MLSNYVVFCEDPPTFTIKGGLVHVEDKSGKLVFQRVMSIHTLRKSIARANKLMDDWEAAQTEPIPFPGKRGDHAAS